MVRRLVHGRHNLDLEHSVLPREFGDGDRLRVQSHGQGKQWGHGTDEGGYLSGWRSIFLYDIKSHLSSLAVVVAMHAIRGDKLRQDQFPDRMGGLFGGELT
jgi:hypothetical protein